MAFAEPQDWPRLGYLEHFGVQEQSVRDSGTSAI
jgi:hypothetical protein